MRNLAIYGAGGLGREIAVMINQINAVRAQWNLIGFFDDGKAKHDTIDDIKILGGIKEVNEISDSCAVVIAIANSKNRKSIFEKIKNTRIDFPVLIHPNALTGSHANRFGEGSIITAGCILTTGVNIGRFTIINLSSTVGHDVRLGNFCSVMPGCNLSGNVTVGDGSLIGTGTQILQNVTLGENCRIGAGAVVIRDIGDGLTVVGVPANRLV